MLARILFRVRGLLVVLTARDAVGYFASCLAETPQFVKLRRLDLIRVDRRVKKKLRVRYKGVRLAVDCPRIDWLLSDENPTFSAIRELYSKDVYLKFFDLSKIEMRAVVDAGGNRGLFTIFAAQLADLVIWIEFQDYKYRPALRTLTEDNAPRGKIVEIGGVLAPSDDPSSLAGDKVNEFYLESGRARAAMGLDGKTPLVTLSQMVECYVHGRITFLKMDIEGCEFAVMRRADEWIHKVDNMVIEVHRDAGDPTEIVEALRGRGFKTVTADSELRPVPPSRADYIYASAVAALKKGVVSR